eukprot:1159569-Pelagomonas_calceolata.AAC.7
MQPAHEQSGNYSQLGHEQIKSIQLQEQFNHGVGTLNGTIGCNSMDQKKEKNKKKDNKDATRWMDNSTCTPEACAASCTLLIASCVHQGTDPRSTK